MISYQSFIHDMLSRLGIGPGAHGIYFVDTTHREHVIQVKKSNL
jgi:hypothetical protein